MRKKFLLLLMIFAIGMTLFGLTVFAQDDYGLSATAEAAKLQKYGTDLPTMIGNVIGAVLSLVAVIFFALMLYGGFKWMVARGNEEEAKKALETIFAAIIGLLIILAAYAITKFVFTSVKEQGAATPTTETGVCWKKDMTKTTTSQCPLEEKKQLFDKNICYVVDINGCGSKKQSECKNDCAWIVPK